MKIFITSLLLTIAFTAAAQTAESIIAQHIAARGGLAMDSIRTAKMTATMYPKNMPSLQFNTTATIENMIAHRMDLRVPSRYDAVICISGNTGWNQLTIQDSTQTNTIDSMEVQELKYQIEILGPLHQYKQKGYTATLLGIEQVNQSDAYKIQINAAHNTTYTCYIDTKSLLVVKEQIIAPVSGVLQTIELYFSNMQPVAGVMMPYTIEMHNKKGVMVSNFTEILLNMVLDKGIFVKPN